MIAVIEAMSFRRRAAEREYRLTIAETTVNFSGRPQQALTVNGGIPAPTLYFNEGDVTNRFRRRTSIHWHGMLIPPGMGWRAFVSFPPIQPGATFTYRLRSSIFPLLSSDFG
jgi:FtsP/CotA-like multicopper oxidase with cupredoxin domain